jgi:biotin carboxylase
VLRWTPEIDPGWAFDFARQASPSGRVLVERFLPGPQVSTESLVFAGRVQGVVKGDVVVQEGVPHLIELAGRLSGGRFCTHEIPLATGVDFVAHAIRLALGQAPDPAALRPRFSRGVAQRYLFPAPGRVVRVVGEEAVRRMPGTAFCEVRVAPGDAIGPIHSHPARAGSVIATGDTREQAVARAVAAVAAIRIETTPHASGEG